VKWIALCNRITSNYAQWLGISVIEMLQMFHTVYGKQMMSWSMVYLGGITDSTTMVNCWNMIHTADDLYQCRTRKV